MHPARLQRHVLVWRVDNKSHWIFFVTYVHGRLLFYRWNVSYGSFWTPSRLMNYFFGQVQNNHWKNPHICYNFHKHIFKMWQTLWLLSGTTSLQHVMWCWHYRFHICASSPPVWPLTLWLQHDWRSAKIDWNNRAEYRGSLSRHHGSKGLVLIRCGWVVVVVGGWGVGGGV